MYNYVILHRILSFHKTLLIIFSYHLIVCVVTEYVWVSYSVREFLYWVILMKKIIIGVLGVLLLGGGAGGGYMYLKKPAEASLTDEAKAEEKKHAKKKKGHEDHSEFVQLDPLILPIVNKDGLSQVVSIVVALEVKDKHDAEFVNKMQPKIKDAFIQEMYGVIHNPKGLHEGQVVRVEILKKRLGKIGHKVLGDDVVQDVLLQVVQQRPI